MCCACVAHVLRRLQGPSVALQGAGALGLGASLAAKQTEQPCFCLSSPQSLCTWPCVQALLAAGASPNKKDRDGRVALHRAVAGAAAERELWRLQVGWAGQGRCCCSTQ